MNNSFHSLRFGRSADKYSGVAHIQDGMAEKLLEFWSATEHPSKILEMGCGTGQCTRKLSAKFPNATLVATDGSSQMVKATEHHLEIKGNPRSLLTVKILDAEFAQNLSPDIPKEAPFDLLVSNALVQWFPDLSGHLQLCRTWVRPGAIYLVSGFLPSNFPELNSILCKPPFSYAHFPGHTFSEIMDQGRLANWGLEKFYGWEETEVFPTPMDVLRRIQSLGSARHPREGGKLNRKNLEFLISLYQEKYGNSTGVPLTWKPWIASLRFLG